MRVWRKVREWLCRLGVDSACYRSAEEDAEREARQRQVIWRFEALVAEVDERQRQRQRQQQR